MEVPLTRTVLVITAVAAEATAVLDALRPAVVSESRTVSESTAVSELAVGPYRGCRVAGDATVAVLAGGIGPAAAAAATAAGLALQPEVQLVLSVGIAGGFAEAGVAVGDTVLAASSVYADLGADTPAGFQSAAGLGWSAVEYAGSSTLLAAVGERLRSADLIVHTGAVITVSTVTGTANRATELYARHRPVAEAMEGAAVAATAARFGCPFLELRTVSNPVGRRNRTAWDIPGALVALREALAAARPVLLAGRG